MRGDIRHFSSFRSHTIHLEAGQTSVGYEHIYPINFNPNEWRLRAIAIGISAKQSYTPTPLSPGIVTLGNNANLHSINPDNDVLILNESIGWGFFDSSHQKSIVGTTPLDIAEGGIPPEKVEVVVNHIYSISLVAVTSQRCFVDHEISIIAEQWVDNPTTTPTVGRGSSSGEGVPDPFQWVYDNLFMVGILGVIGIGGLLAAAYAGREFREERQFAGEVSRDVRSKIKSRKT